MPGHCTRALGGGSVAAPRHEVVELVRTHYPTPLPTAEVLERFGLLGLERRQTGGLSGGQKCRLAVALGLCRRPQSRLLG